MCRLILLHRLPRLIHAFLLSAELWDKNRQGSRIDPLLSYGQKHENFQADAADSDIYRFCLEWYRLHQIDQVMEKPSAATKIKTSFFNGLMTIWSRFFYIPDYALEPCWKIESAAVVYGQTAPVTHLIRHDRTGASWIPKFYLGHDESVPWNIKIMRSWDEVWTKL